MQTSTQEHCNWSVSPNIQVYDCWYHVIELHSQIHTACEELTCALQSAVITAHSLRADIKGALLCLDILPFRSHNTSAHLLLPTRAHCRKEALYKPVKFKKLYMRILKWLVRHVIFNRDFQKSHPGDLSGSRRLLGPGNTSLVNMPSIFAELPPPPGVKARLMTVHVLCKSCLERF